LCQGIGRKKIIFYNLCNWLVKSLIRGVKVSVFLIVPSVWKEKFLKNKIMPSDSGERLLFLFKNCAE
jgi:hypothetical protein